MSSPGLLSIGGHCSLGCPALSWAHTVLGPGWSDDWSYGWSADVLVPDWFKIWSAPARPGQSPGQWSVSSSQLQPAPDRQQESANDLSTQHLYCHTLPNLFTRLMPDVINEFIVTHFVLAAMAVMAVLVTHGYLS